MSLNGIDAVVFGVADMAEAKRFLDDWGVTQVLGRSGQARLSHPRQCEVIVRPRTLRICRRRLSRATPCAK